MLILQLPEKVKTSYRAMDATELAIGQAFVERVEDISIPKEVKLAVSRVDDDSDCIYYIKAICDGEALDYAPDDLREVTGTVYPVEITVTGIELVEV